MVTSATQRCEALEDQMAGVRTQLETVETTMKTQEEVLKKSMEEAVQRLDNRFELFRQQQEAQMTVNTTTQAQFFEELRTLLMCLADLEFDNINPYDSAIRINQVVLPEYVIQAGLTLLFLLTGHWIMALLCAPYLYYNVKTLCGCSGCFGPQPDILVVRWFSTFRWPSGVFKGDGCRSYGGFGGGIWGKRWFRGWDLGQGVVSREDFGRRGRFWEFRPAVFKGTRLSISSQAPMLDPLHSVLTAEHIKYFHVYPAVISACWYMDNKHFVDVTEIFNLLNWEKKKRLIKLGYLLLILFLSLFWMIWTTLEDDEELY
uniref:Uncharacterized protein n=1 Tax=Chenopodium quinoa TaxID=63459 RepID=A0A803LQZ7_CHEQI